MINKIALTAKKEEMSHTKIVEESQSVELVMVIATLSVLAISGVITNGFVIR